MREQLTAHINALFRGAALTVQNAELREEILQNTVERYDDLLAEGKSPEDAYREAIRGIGDVSGLIQRETDFPNHPPVQPVQKPPVKAAPVEMNVPPRAPARGVAGSLIGALWMLAVAFYFFISIRYNAWAFSWLIFLVTPAITCWIGAINAASRKGAQASKGGLIGGMWLLTVAVYFVLSALTRAWHITWLLFLIAAALSFLIDAIYDAAKGGKRYES